MIFPVTPAAVHIYSVAPSQVSISPGLETNARTSNRQRWGMRISLPAMQRADWATAYGYLCGQAGRYEGFELAPPGIAGRGVLTGSPTVSGGAQSGRTLTTAGWSVSQTGIIQSGDFFRIENKVYIATADANSDGDGDAALTIDPALIASPAHGASLTVVDVPFMVALVDDSLEGTYTRDGVYMLAFDVIEVA